MRSPRSQLLSVLLLAFIGHHSLAVAGSFRSAVPTERVADWIKRQQAISAAVAQCEEMKKVRVVFVGDSITDYWQMGDNPWHEGARGGAAIWAESFDDASSPNHALNVGITGDRTENVLHRITPQSAGGLGHLGDDCLAPEFVVVMIGINNRWAGEEPLTESIYAGVAAVVEKVRQVKPAAIVVLQSILPYHETEINRRVIEPVNERLAELPRAHPEGASIRFLDLYPLFLRADRSLRDELFYDGLHPNEAGYRVWRDALVPFLERIRNSMTMNSRSFPGTS